LGSEKGIWPVNSGVVGCWRRYLKKEKGRVVSRDLSVVNAEFKIRTLLDAKIAGVFEADFRVFLVISVSLQKNINAFGQQ